MTYRTVTFSQAWGTIFKICNLFFNFKKLPPTVRFLRSQKKCRRALIGSIKRKRLRENNDEFLAGRQTFAVEIVMKRVLIFCE